VAEKDNKIYFIEVKSVSHETPDSNPEDNMHMWKMQRLSRVIQTYILSKHISEEKEWQVDLLVVYLNLKTGESRVKVVSDIIL
jgi:Holliday junction resolvase-like predicted endonuclease